MGHQEAGASPGTSVAEHQKRILSAIQPLAPVSLALAEALDRTLVEPVSARDAVPGFDNSAMDGYALRSADAATATPGTPVTLVVVGDLPAGSADDPPIGVGEAVRIMTGAPIPSDADCVVPLEHSDGGTTRVIIARAPRPGAHIRRAASDVHAGEAVLPVGRILRAQDLSAAAATGTATLRVHPAPRVAVISTGTELRPAGDPLGRGQIHDSNSVLLGAAITECGGIPQLHPSVPDDDEVLRSLLDRISPTVDAIVTTGGASVGAYDVVKAVLAPRGVWFGPVRMQPGKPQGFGSWPDPDAGSATPIFALPGNPVGVFVSFEVFVRPALLALQGRSELRRDTISGVVAQGWTSPADRVQYMPAIVDEQADGSYAVRPAGPGGSGSSLVVGLARANALAAVPEGVTEVHPGDRVDVTLLR
jgi:molybdopterin molybdotransferase